MLKNSDWEFPPWVGTPTEIVAFAYGEIDFEGVCISRHAAESMAAQIEAKYPQYKAHFKDRAEDGSKGVVVLSLISF